MTLFLLERYGNFVGYMCSTTLTSQQKTNSTDVERNGECTLYMYNIMTVWMNTYCHANGTILAVCRFHTIWQCSDGNLMKNSIFVTIQIDWICFSLLSWILLIHDQRFKAHADEYTRCFVRVWKFKKKIRKKWLLWLQLTIQKLKNQKWEN